VALHTCPTSITAAGTYDACQFNGDLTVDSPGVVITRSRINGAVQTADGMPAGGLVIRDSTIACGCPSVGNGTTIGINQDGFTLVRVDLSGSGHGAAPQNHVVIQDTWIHGLGGPTQDHKNGIYSGDGTDVQITHNSVECDDGSGGCSSAIGLMSDFGVINHYTITKNLLNTIGAFCFYGGDGNIKAYNSQFIVFTDNVFGRAIYPNCGYYGPVTSFDMTQPGMVWANNTWADTGAVVPPDN
jgi:hypothetical protein